MSQPVGSYAARGGSEPAALWHANIERWLHEAYNALGGEFSYPATVFEEAELLHYCIAVGMQFYFESPPATGDDASDARGALGNALYFPRRPRSANWLIEAVYASERENRPPA